MDRQSNLRVIVSRRSSSRGCYINPPSPKAIDCQRYRPVKNWQVLWWEVNEAKFIVDRLPPGGRHLYSEVLDVWKENKQYYVRYQILVITVVVVPLIDYNY